MDMMVSSTSKQAASRAGCVRVPLKVEAREVEDASDRVELVVERPVTPSRFVKSPESSTPYPRHITAHKAVSQAAARGDSKR